MEQKTDCSDTHQRALENVLGVGHNPDNQVTAGVVENLKEGWAKSCFKGDKAHYWHDVTSKHEHMISHGERVKVYRSMCGEIAHVHPRFNPMFHPGTVKKCKRCKPNGWCKPNA